MSAGMDEVSGLAAASAAGARLSIVGIGASAGGIEAFRGFFERAMVRAPLRAEMPDDTMNGKTNNKHRASDT